MSWRGIITLLMLAGALLSGWSVWTQRNKDAAPAGPVGRSDYVLDDFELIALDAQGKESFTLRAPKLVRDPKKKTLDIATPVFLIPPSDGSSGDAWEVRSKIGWVSAEGDELRLRGAVKATSAGYSGAPMTMATEQLNVFPEAKRAASPTKVVITRPGSILSGRGLQLNLANKQYQFQSEVRSRYVPTPR